MNLKPKPYEWNTKDRWLYAVSMLPFGIVFIGTVYLLATYSVYLSITFLALYLMANVFQAGCCVGCPYQGGYCPAICGVYLGNLLAGIFYRKRTFDAKFFKVNATAAEITLLLLVLFPLYWLWRTHWALIFVYFALILAHFASFMPVQCEKCSYHETCPGGQTWLRCRRYLGGG
jgi:hypothetical protein